MTEANHNSIMRLAISLFWRMMLYSFVLSMVFGAVVGFFLGSTGNALFMQSQRLVFQLVVGAPSTFIACYLAINGLLKSTYRDFQLKLTPIGDVSDTF